jgi:hypothetical protein
LTDVSGIIVGIAHDAFPKIGAPSGATSLTKIGVVTTEYGAPYDEGDIR